MIKTRQPPPAELKYFGLPPRNHFAGTKMENLKSDTKEFYEQKFERLDLSDDELREKTFYDCEFINCNFSNAKLLNNKFNDCIFSSCNLSNASLKGSACRGVSFKSCKLVGIDWTKLRWPSVPLSGQIEFDECILNGASFFGLYLQELKLEACQAQDVDFTDADCSYASFIQTDFSNSTFSRANLTKADFSDACNYQIDIFSNKITDATFSLPEAMCLLRSLPIKLVE